jgi:peptidoglycan lytic transglycosylase G
VVARTLALAAAALAAAVVVAGCGGDPAKPKPTVPAGPKVLHIVFPEGFTRKEMAERIDAVRKIAHDKRHVTPRMTSGGYLAATASSKLPALYAGDSKTRPLEGFLFPARYAFFSDETARHFVARQVGALKLAMRKVDMSYARAKNLTRYDILIIASMIEREVVVPSERPLVAAVIYNRLHDHVPIGIDAALRYGLNIPPTKSITNADLASDSPYNVRKFTGLPPTPIGNPGLASIQAAAHPAKVPYLYYARKKDRRHHFFTASYAAFQQFLAANGYG